MLFMATEKLTLHFINTGIAVNYTHALLLIFAIFVC